MRISLIQMDVSFGDPIRNWQRVEQRVSQAVAQEGSNWVVLPELWNTGYDLTRFEKIADRGELPEKLAMLAKQHQIYLVAGSIGEKEGEQFYNSSYIFSPEGRIVTRYRKVHLFRLMEEEKVLTAGKRDGALFPLGDDWGGLMICYDLRFPEFTRSLAIQGAKILFVVAEWPHPRLNHWRLLNQARAIENQMVIVAVNRVGTDPNNQFCGHSMVIDPWGEILVEGDEQEGIYTTDVDLSQVTTVRKKIPVFEDRMPDCY
ncbi:carbon-nitrogen family hydrolase [Marininema halotolerans]|uniref:Predicted amidohydrolase n=1 Tax=Marininema halotolerans TaxID=1155944 RepID=A0A1I6R2P6_9BACL|nr:carbon-nitrogen family hydrolase [Marininema halotolerans]SFS58972.1 Predicted amidohydrolase [Marininema halotolerans]